MPNVPRHATRLHSRTAATESIRHRTATPAVAPHHIEDDERDLQELTDLRRAALDNLDRLPNADSHIRDQFLDRLRRLTADFSEELELRMRNPTHGMFPPLYSSPRLPRSSFTYNLLPYGCALVRLYALICIYFIASAAPFLCTRP